MKKPPHISIVTISFNQAEFIERTLCSVLEQDYPGLEYIVVDGGSTDGSLAIIERYRTRVAKILVGRDQGPADALNKGFSHAHGEWLGFLNSDDTLLPGALANLTTLIKRWPQVDFFSGHCLVTDGKDTVLRRTYSDPYSVRRMAYDGCIVLQPATFFRRKLFMKAGGFEINNTISWDWELFVRFGMLGARHRTLEAFLATYRLHAGSITGTNRVEAGRQKIRDQILKRYLARDLRWWDEPVRFFYRYWRKVLNPRDTWERIMGGPIGGRYSVK